ncbi:MAG: Gfo/Idh/MocA family oxidoreductase [Phycisphaerales bacterium]
MAPRTPPTDPGLSRRDFVLTSAGALAGAALAGTLARPAYAVGGSDTLRVGVIGCGGRGGGAVMQALRADKGAVLYAMADVFPERIESQFKSLTRALSSEENNTRVTPAQLDVPPDRRFSGFDGYQKVIDLCDVVLLATPPHFRPAPLKAAVERGRHIFCEKPVAVDAPGVRSVLETVELARQKKLALVSGHCWRYSARERETFGRLCEGGLGDIRATYTTYNADGWVEPKKRKDGWSDMEFQLRNWHYFAWLSGDHIVEQAVHSIDKNAWAMNGALPTRCTAVGGRQGRPDTPETGHVYDHFSATWEYASGARGFHMCRHFPGTPTDNSDYILGSDGICTINGWTKTHEITGKNPWKSTHPGNDMYQQEHDDLFAAIRAGKPINDGVWMTHSTLMAIMARMAAYTGQAVTWEQALNSKERLGPESYEFGEVPVPPVAIPGKTKFI